MGALGTALGKSDKHLEACKKALKNTEELKKHRPTWTARRRAKSAEPAQSSSTQPIVG